MHNVAIFRVTAKNVVNDFAKRLREKTFVYVLDGVVNVFFHGTDATHHVSLFTVHWKEMISFYEGITIKLKFYSGGFRRTGFSLKAVLLVKTEDVGENVGRECAHGDIICLYRSVKFVAALVDAVLRTFQLCL